MAIEDNVTVSLTEDTHAILQKFKNDGIFNEMQDGYRFGIAFAIARGLIAPANFKTRTTFLNVGSLDKDGSLRNLITEIYPDSAERPYAMAERLAEAGLTEMGRQYENDQLQFGKIYKAVVEIL
jgi:hypothetical protein